MHLCLIKFVVVCLHIITHIFTSKYCVVVVDCLNQQRHEYSLPSASELLMRRTFLESVSKRILRTSGRIVGTIYLDSIFTAPDVDAIIVDETELDVLLFSKFYAMWTGTNLPLLSLQQSVEILEHNTNLLDHWPMGRWPDPVLRRPADPVEERLFGGSTLARACELLAKTARLEGAVGLAAQQCGVNARIVVLNNLISRPWTNRIATIKGGTESDYLVLINPRIVERSKETEMKIWTEECLVLPPSFRATVLRDYWIQVECQDLTGTWNTCRLFDEMARVAQHELDHDRGILLTDHISFNEMENEIMQQIEQQESTALRENEYLPNRNERVEMAYNRYVEESMLSS
jgi:peptide deformylase